MAIEKRKAFIINITYFALIIAIVYIALKYALGLLMPFLIGFLVAFLLKRVINFIAKKTRIPRKAVAVFSVLLFYAVAGVLLSWLGIRIFAGLKDMVVKLPEIYLTDIEPAILGLFESMEKAIAGFDPLMVQSIENMAASLTQSMGEVITGISSKVIGYISSAAAFVPGLFLSIIFAVISSVHFAVDHSKITGFITGLFSPKYQKFLTEAKSFASGIGFKYVKAYAALMLLTFTELAVGLSILRVDGALSIAALTAVIDVLPVFGTGIVVIPWSIIELIKGNTPLAIGLAVLYVVITVVRNIMEPKLVGKQIGLHPLIMLICMYVGVRLFGFTGLFALPIIAVIVKYLYDNGKLYFNSKPA